MPDFGVGSDLSLFPLVGIGDRRADAMTVQQRGDDPAVQEMPRSSRELIARSPLSDGKLAVPVALEVETCWVIRSTSPAESLAGMRPTPCPRTYPHPATAFRLVSAPPYSLAHLLKTWERGGHAPQRHQNAAHTPDGTPGTA